MLRFLQLQVILLIIILMALLWTLRYRTLLEIRLLHPLCVAISIGCIVCIARDSQTLLVANPFVIVCIAGDIRLCSIRCKVTVASNLYKNIR